jgi:hypothetical protein
MREAVPVELPKHVVRSAHAVAARRHRRIEDVLNQSTGDWYSQLRRKTGLNGVLAIHVYQCRVVRFS